MSPIFFFLMQTSWLFTSS